MQVWCKDIVRKYIMLYIHNVHNIHSRSLHNVRSAHNCVFSHSQAYIVQTLCIPLAKSSLRGRKVEQVRPIIF
jgi:hypothetical protein